ncbi:MAG: VCBS repeat-containing protein [Myxococcota bacterium]
MRLSMLSLLVCVAACGEAEPPPGTLAYRSLGRAWLAEGVADRVLARLDVNGDGLDDLIVGGNAGGTLAPDRIVVLVSEGDGTFRDASAEHLSGELRASAPIGVQADLNGDGIDDLAIFDAGNPEAGQEPEGGFQGGRPALLLSAGASRWVVSDALADAVARAPDEVCYLGCDGTLHAKSATSGDVDGDGDVDLWVESGGGYRSPRPHFLINQGDGTFVLDASDERRSEALISGPTGAWRYAAHLLEDMDGDGDLDLVMGQLRRQGNDQDALRNRIVFNDGSGRFPAEASLELPHVAWNEGFTYVKALAALDLDGDGALDLVLAHQRGNVIPDPEGVGNTGRYLQALLARGEGFEDASAAFFGDQSATMEATLAPYGSNFNTPDLLAPVDLDLDGRTDLVMALAGPIGDHAPYAYVAGEDGAFTALAGDAVTRERWWGERAYPIDLDGDGDLDLVHADLRPGADGRYGTADDRTELIASRSSVR